MSKASLQNPKGPDRSSEDESLFASQSEGLWIRSHVCDVPNKTISFCGDVIRDARMLNVGCGEMLSDVGFLTYKPKLIMGLDVTPTPSANFPHELVKKVARFGYNIDSGYEDIIKFTQYPGLEFPFEDESFDFVFSWSAFEHIPDIRDVLAEMHRVVTRDGCAYVQVFPWFLSRYGSHLQDWIKEPFFHHHREMEWVEQKLEAYSNANPDANNDFINKYMLSEYRSLNRKSSADFYEAARDVGFKVKKARIISYDEDLTDAPRGVHFADLMIGGTEMLLKKA